MLRCLMYPGCSGSAHEITQQHSLNLLYSLQYTFYVTFSFYFPFYYPFYLFVFECCIRMDSFDSCSFCLWSVWCYVSSICCLSHCLCFSPLHSPQTQPQRNRNALSITLSKQQAANLCLSPKHHSRRENREFSVVDLAAELWNSRKVRVKNPGLYFQPDWVT